MLKRTMYFVYGAISYLIFLATFLYAIAFVGGFWVPAQLDGRLSTSVSEALLIDLGLLAAFAIQHSVMARRWFKDWWTQMIPWAIERIHVRSLRKPSATFAVLAVAADRLRSLVDGEFDATRRHLGIVCGGLAHCAGDDVLHQSL